MINIPQNCLECGQAYLKKDATLVLEGKDNFIFHLTCNKCQLSTLMKITVGSKGILSVVKMTDADKKDINKLKDNKAISANDVIQTYMSLKKHRVMNKEIRNDKPTKNVRC
ncbi:MAG: hypothetical protein FJZ04_01420 [Candidatus Moranbacteria bacterium]|nr:hypothetical protein [Candidatus Moranbacteria bacterium]